MKRGDVVLVDFPFSDRRGSKLRPALVIQATALHASRDDTILAAISRSQRFANTEVVIDPTTTEGALSGLRHLCVVDCALLGTFDQNLIKHTLGSLPATLMATVNDRLKIRARYLVTTCNESLCIASTINIPTQPRGPALMPAAPEH